jgi:two-component system response regulator NreC
MPVKLLSSREQEVLKLLAQGYTNKEAGTQLCLSVKTIESYRARLGDKLGRRSRADLTRFALEIGLLDPGPSSSGQLSVPPPVSGFPW